MSDPRGNLYNEPGIVGLRRAESQLVELEKQTRLRALVDAAKAVCSICRGVYKEALPLRKEGKRYEHFGDVPMVDELVKNAHVGCVATDIWKTIESEYGLDTVKKHSPRKWTV